MKGNKKINAENIPEKKSAIKNINSSIMWDANAARMLDVTKISVLKLIDFTNDEFENIVVIDVNTALLKKFHCIVPRRRYRL